MPIRPQHRWLWVKGCCEQCARPHGKTVSHLGDGRWWCEETSRWRDGHGRLQRLRTPPALLTHPVSITRVILATANLDSDLTNNAQGNLKALCQRCHMIHDRPEHLRRRRIGYLMSRALGYLFTGRKDVAFGNYQRSHPFQARCRSPFLQYEPRSLPEHPSVGAHPITFWKSFSPEDPRPAQTPRRKSGRCRRQSGRIGQWLRLWLSD